MAKGKLFTIFDVKALECGPVFPGKNDDIAIRQWQYIMDGNGGNRITHPEDYHLYCIADFDSETMIVEPNRYQVNTALMLEPEGV